MLKVSRLTDYATLVMTCMAERPHEVLRAVQLADIVHLELPTVSKLLKVLSQAGLVESFRGVNGGYRLARPAGQISLAEIVVAMEGPIGVTDCSLADRHCELESNCGVRGSWRRVSDALDGALRSIHLSDMLRPPAAATAAAPLRGDFEVHLDRQALVPGR
ncbi:SUF system Fe-S cluster assembly regulator [Frateuria aurantia]